MSLSSKTVLFERQIGGFLPGNLTDHRRSFSSRSSCVGRKERSLRGVVRAETTQSAEYRWPDWGEAWRFLSDNGLRTVSPQRSQEMVESGKWKLVDVRPRSSFEKCHPDGTTSIPLFDDIDWSNASPMAYLRAAAYLVNGVTPVTVNDDFEKELKECVKDGKGLIFYCETGGTMIPSTNFMYGKESRSLKACYRTLQMDSSIAVAHMEDGLLGWYRSGMPLIGEYDMSNAGRTPNIAKAPEIKSGKK